MLQSVVGRFVRRFSSVQLPSTAAYVSNQAVPACEYSERRQKLVECLRETTLGNTDKPLLVLARASPRHYFAPDVPYPYHQCSYFRYLTGYTQPDAVLLIIAEAKKKPTSILYVQGMSTHILAFLTELTELYSSKFFYFLIFVPPYCKACLYPVLLVHSASWFRHSNPISPLYSDLCIPCLYG